MTPYIYPGMERIKQIAFKRNMKDIRGGVDYIIDFTCQSLELKKDDVLSPCRKRELAEARVIAIGLILMNVYITLKDLGKIFNRDHSSIIHCRDLFHILNGSDKIFTKKVQKILSQI